MQIPPRDMFREGDLVTYQAPDPSIAPVSRSLFPEGAKMVFCIGAQKAGTTWLYSYLGRSESVHFSRNKELHYFDVRAGKARLALQMRVDALSRLSAKLDTRGSRLNAHVVDSMVDAAELLRIYTGTSDGADRHLPYLQYLGLRRNQI